LAEIVEPNEASSEKELPISEAPAEAPPERVIQIQVPKPFDEDALEPFLDLYMEKRGLTDRKQAAVRLARSLSALGYNPQREIQNVTAYINNLSTVMNAIPDTEETLPVKGTLLARGAAESDRLLRRGHFGSGGDDLDEMKALMRFATRARVTMRMLDTSFAGDQMGMENKTVAELRTKVERMEKEREFDAALAPIKQQLSALQETLRKLSEKPKTEEESTALKEVRQSVDKINERLDKKEQQDSLLTEMKGVRDELKGLGEKFKGGEGKGVADVGDAFDQAVTLIDKITELTKKHGGAGEGEIDWKATAITTAGEIATETIKAARDIMSGKEVEEEEAKPKETKKETVSERIVDRKLLNYVRERVATGAATINSKTAAKELNLTEEQIIESHNRLKEKGLIVSPGEAKKKGLESDTAKSAEEWVEGY